MQLEICEQLSLHLGIKEQPLIATLRDSGLISFAAFWVCAIKDLGDDNKRSFRKVGVYSKV
jgi:hypothetical protein